MKMQTLPSLRPGLRVTPGTVTTAATIIGLAVVFWQGGRRAVALVEHAENAVQGAAFLLHVRQDSTHLALLDSAVLVGQRENRVLLCAMAKNPAPFIAAGICPAIK